MRGSLSNGLHSPNLPREYSSVPTCHMCQRGPFGSVHVSLGGGNSFFVWQLVSLPLWVLFSALVCCTKIRTPGPRIAGSIARAVRFSSVEVQELRSLFEREAELKLFRSGVENRHTVDGRTPAPPKKPTGMIRVPCKYQTMVSHGF